MTDLVLAILHHLLVFLLAFIIAAEFVLMKSDMSLRDLKILTHIDRMYGLVAMLVLAVGAARVAFGLRGWEFYAGNHAFWGKIAAFAIVGLLSVKPTLAILRWSRQAKEAGFQMPVAEIKAMRRFLVAEIAVFALIPVFAAMMARNFG